MKFSKILGKLSGLERLLRKREIEEKVELQKLDLSEQLASPAELKRALFLACGKGILRKKRTRYRRKAYAEFLADLYPAERRYAVMKWGKP